MARPLKDGLDYFPLDVGFLGDKKVKLIKAEFGPAAVMIIIGLLAKIYSENGYYKQWDEDDCYLLSEDLGSGCTPELVDEVVQGCVRRSFFDERVFDVFGVLTSPGIQRRYYAAVADRSNITAVKDFFLLDLSNQKDIQERVRKKLTFITESQPKNSINRQKTGVNQPNNSQSKVKQSKAKDSKEEMCATPEVAPPAEVTPVITLPLVDKTDYPVTADQIKEWSELYPAVDILQELRKMKGWLMSNPSRRKTRKGILRFITNWLAKEQDRGRQQKANKPQSGSSGSKPTQKELQHMNNFLNKLREDE